MAERQAPQIKFPDPTSVSQTMASIAERSQNIVSDFLARQVTPGHSSSIDPLNLGSAFLEMTTRMMASPDKMLQAQFNLWQDYMMLWQNTTQRMMGQSVEPMMAPDEEDRRFRDDAWADNQLFDFIKQ